MRVLIACESSGAVRRAFAARGHDVTSCDLLPADDGATVGRHVQGDARPLLAEPWDLVIAHPPCTYLTNSGVRWLYEGGRGTTRNASRWAAMEAGAEFFAACFRANAPRIVVENPIMHGHARAALAPYGIGAPSQIIQPWQFGHGETKATGLWLRGVDPLRPTDVVSGRVARVHRLPPSADRWKLRSATYEGIARAMAAQWG